MLGNPNTRFLLRLIIDLVLLVGVYLVALVLLPWAMATRERGFFCSDITLMYPYKQATLIRQVHVSILVLAVPAACVLCVEMLRSTFTTNGTHTTTTTEADEDGSQVRHYVFVGLRIPTFVSECYSLMGVYLFGLALLLIVLNGTQCFIGRLGPYFFEVCQPQLAFNVSACAELHHFGRYIEQYTCGALTATPRLLAQMRQSFPSSYAGTSAYAMCFLVAYLQARLRARWLHLCRSLCQMACGIIVVLVASERVSSHRHHETDVLAGIALGCVMALFMTHAVAALFRPVPPKMCQLPEDPSASCGYHAVAQRTHCY